MEDSGDDSEDGDSSDKRVPASRQRGEEQLGTSTQWADFSVDGCLVRDSGHNGSTSVMTLAEDLLVIH